MTNLFRFSKSVEEQRQLVSTFLSVKIEDLTNQLANFFSAEGFKRGDIIALILENSLEYPCVWVGMSKIGCITALINTNLRGKPLIHSISTVNAKSVITSTHILSGKMICRTE